MSKSQAVAFGRYEPDYQKHLMVLQDDGEYVRHEDMSAIVGRILHAVSELDLTDEQRATFVYVVNGQLS